MKKTLFYLSIALVSYQPVSAQINAITSLDGSVTISPKGLTSKYTNNFNNNSSIGLGDGALFNNRYATRAIAIGTNAHFNVSAGSGDYQINNIAIGYEAMFSANPSSITAGFANNAKQNVAIGNGALYLSTIGSFNTAVGHEAMYYNQADYNSAFGFHAVYNNTTGINNSGFGYVSLYANRAASGNTGFGAYSLYQNRSGSGNTAVGSHALYSQNFANNDAVFPTNNVAVGEDALWYNNPTATTNGIRNTAVGTRALELNRIGKSNTAVGTFALNRNAYGAQNTALGDAALEKQSFANANTLFNSNNTAIGFNALNENNPTAVTNGIRNTAVGAESLIGNRTGLSNTAVGASSLAGNTYGSKMVAIGDNALATHSFTNNSNDYDSYNVGIGFEALMLTQPTSAEDGFRNTAVGGVSMRSNTTGTDNVALGMESLYNNTIGTFNTAIGAKASISNVSGYQNVAIGDYALYTNSVGNNNVALGNEAGYYEIGSNRLYIENTSSSTPLIGGNFATDVVGINMPIASLASNTTWKLQVGGDINATGSVRAAGVVLTSDRRFKQNVRPITGALSTIQQLNGYTYDWRTSEFPTRNFNKKQQMGVIAQEIEKLFPDLVDTDADGYKSVNYLQLTPLMIEALKELKKENDMLKNKNQSLESRLDRIEAMLSAGNKTQETK